MKEIWKDIKGYDGRYQVSNKGKVRSLNYRGSKKIKELNPWILSGKKYKFVRLVSDDGSNKRIPIIRLVAENFIPNPNNYKTYRHISSDYSDDSVENIMWCNVSDYIKKLYKENRTYSPTEKKYDYYGDKLTIKQLSKINCISPKIIRERLNRGWNAYESAETPRKRAISNPYGKNGKEKKNGFKI